MKNKKQLKRHRQQAANELQCCMQNYLVKNGPQYFFPLGKLNDADYLMKLCRKMLPANKKWQGTKEGGFYYNGETHLSFCAKLGPIFSVNINSKHMRMKTVLVQWGRDGVIHGYALDVCQGIGPLKDKLCLNEAEANALSSMLDAGKDSFADREYLLKISTRKYLPTAQTACIYWDATDIPIDSEQTLRSIWERIGPAGRETVLAGIFNQLSAKSKSKERPPIIINFVKCGQNLRAIRKLLGAVNFSIQPGVNGTAPNIRKVSTKDDLPFSFGELELYEAGQRGDVFINVLEEHCRPLTQYDSARCPFPAIPLIMTANITLNGNIWNIEIENTIPDLSDVEQDCLRKAASLILQNPQKFST